MTEDEKRARFAALCARLPKHHISTQAERLERTRKQGWLVDMIWPEGTTHLIAGPSGVGKSSWLLPVIKDWSEGKPVLGYPSHPKEWLYLMCDRSETDLQRTLDRLGMSNFDPHAKSIESLGHDPNYMLDPDTIKIADLPDLFPWAKVFFIEAYNWFYGGEEKGGKSSAVQDYQNTLRFWSRVRDSFGQRNRTIVATTHEAKGNEYKSTRDKVYGNVGQVAVSGTIITVEYDEKHKNRRHVRVAPRDSAEFVKDYIFTTDGKFAELSGGEEDPGAAMLLDARLNTIAQGLHIPLGIFKDWMKELDLSVATMERWIKAKQAEGLLQRVSRGLYMRPRTS